MNDKIVLGIILLVATILIGWVGGAICVLAGLIISIVLIAMGAAQPPDKVNKQSDSHYDRHCPNCGRSIPFDARACPYCAKKFIVETTSKVDKIKSDDEPLQILKSRYAKGEITKEEFEQMKKDLE